MMIKLIFISAVLWICVCDRLYYTKDIGSAKPAYIDLAEVQLLHQIITKFKTFLLYPPLEPKFAATVFGSFRKHNNMEPGFGFYRYFLCLLCDTFVLRQAQQNKLRKLHCGAASFLFTESSTRKMVFAKKQNNIRRSKGLAGFLPALCFCA